MPKKGQTLVFARTKHGTERLAKHLVHDGFAAAMIHGDRTQSQRTGALSGFEKWQVSGAGCYRRGLARFTRQQRRARH